jgi:hypothetical protein
VTLCKTLLVLPADRKPTNIRDLLRFAFETFSFAFGSSADAQDLFLSTDDDFLLPPNAPLAQALDPNQVVKLGSIVHKLGKNKSASSTDAPPQFTSLFNIPVNNAEVIQPSK